MGRPQRARPAQVLREVHPGSGRRCSPTDGSGAVGELASGPIGYVWFHQGQASWHHGGSLVTCGGSVPLAEELLGRGYLPKELPPSFSSTDFSKVSTSLKAIPSPNQRTHSGVLNLARPENLRRRLELLKLGRCRHGRRPHIADTTVTRRVSRKLQTRRRTTTQRMRASTDRGSTSNTRPAPARARVSGHELRHRPATATRVTAQRPLRDRWRRCSACGRVGLIRRGSG